MLGRAAAKMNPPSSAAKQKRGQAFESPQERDDRAVDVQDSTPGHLTLPPRGFILGKRILHFYLSHASPNSLLKLLTPEFTSIFFYLSPFF